MHEFDFIAWLRSRTSAHPFVRVGLGDDAAVLEPTVRPLLVTTDVLTEGVDFRLAEASPRRIGRKAMAVNLSDIAAMAGVPRAAVAGLVLPKTGGGELAQGLYAGMREVADEFDVPLVGGDTNSWDGPLAVSVTVLGEATARGPVLRGGARSGDWLFVTGPLGGSILGHHFDFTPRVREALRLHEEYHLHAMIDVSDGLAADLNHVLVESGCGAVLYADSIPITRAARELSLSSGRTPLQHALGDGEDFELIFSVSPTDGARLQRDPTRLGIAPAKIGECVAAGLWLETDGSRHSLEPAGWVHALS